MLEMANAKLNFAVLKISQLAPTETYLQKFVEQSTNQRQREIRILGGNF